MLVSNNLRVIMNSVVDITILICTYNSSSKLEKTLNHIKKQVNVDNINFEVLIVDYKSIDDTLGEAKKIWGDHHIPMRLISEKLPGKTPALETGFIEAKGIGVCIVDDDNWIDDDYVFLANKILKENLDVGVVGAFGLAHCEVTPPEWFAENQASYAVGSQGNGSGYVTDINRMWVWGAGSVFRKAAWISAKSRGFVPLLNPFRGVGSFKFQKGFAGGEDSELCYAVQLAGYRLWYEPSLVYTHYIPTARLTKEYLNLTNSGTQAAAPIVRLYLSELSQRSTVSKFRKFIYQRWLLHFLYTFFIYIKSILNTCFSGLKDKPLRLSVVNKTYIAQLKMLYSLRSDFHSIVISIQKLASKK
jgi:glycosyltransferase involved in cell wall biosynthesis